MRRAHSEADRIRAARPFRDRIDLERVEPAGSDGAHSGTAFFVTDRTGRRFKLRALRHPLRATAIARSVRALPEVFPALVAREGRFLLLETLEDYRPVTRSELLGRGRELGRIAARIHQRTDPVLARQPWLRRAVAARTTAAFVRDLALLARRRIVPVSSARGALAKFRDYLGRFGLPIALELDDLHKGNVMIRESDGDLRYVDEEGVGLRPRGMGLASLMKTATYRHHWRLFRAGYADVADAAFLNEPYTEYLLLLDATRRVARKVRTGSRAEKLPREIAELREMTDRPDLALDWRFPRG